MSINSKARSGLKWTTVSTIVLAISAMIKISVLARFLEKADFGVVAIVLFVLGFIELFNDMGISTAILARENITKHQYASLYWINWIISIVIYVLILIISPFVAMFYSSDLLRSLLPLLGINLVLSAIGRQFKTIEQKNLRFKWISVIDVTASVVSLSVSVFLAIYNYGVYSLVYSLILQIFISNVLYLLIGLRKYQLLFHYNFSEIKPFFKIGMYQVGGQFVNYFNRDMDVLLIGKLFGPDILGGYSLARDLVRKPSAIILPIVNKVGAPLLAKVKEEKADIKKYFLRLTSILSVVTIYLFLGIVVLAPFIVEIVYGAKYSDIVILVQILSINMVLRIITGNIGNLVIATGRTDLDFKWNVYTLAVTPLCVIIGAQVGIIAVAAMVSLSMVLLFVPNYLFVVKKLLPSVTFKEYTAAFFSFNPKLINNKI